MRLMLWLVKMCFFLLAVVWAIPWTILGVGIMAISGPLGFLVGLASIGIGGLPLGALLGASLVKRVDRQSVTRKAKELSGDDFERFYRRSGNEIDFLLVEWEE